MSHVLVIAGHPHALNTRHLNLKTKKNYYRIITENNSHAQNTTVLQPTVFVIAIHPSPVPKKKRYSFGSAKVNCKLLGQYHSAFISEGNADQEEHRKTIT